MPWYTNPVTTCKVLNRVARRYNDARMEEFKAVLDAVTDLIWRKQERYYETHGS